MSFDCIAVTSHFLCILQMTHHLIFFDNDKVQCLGVEKLVEEDVITHEESNVSYFFKSIYAIEILQYA